MNMNGYIGYYPKFSVYPDEKVRKGVTTHTLTYSPGTAASLLIVIGGVLQEPDEAYTVSGNTVTFAELVPDTGWIQYRSIETSSDFTKVLEPVLKRLDALEGVGGLPIFEEKTASYTATRSSAVSLKMSDGVNKTVTVDQTMISDDWFAIDLTDWKRSSELLTVTIDFGSQALSSGDASFDKLIVDYPCTLYFQKVGTVWKITDGAGLGSTSEKLISRIIELESWPQLINTPTGRAVKHRDGRLECWARVTFSPAPLGTSASSTKPTWAHPFVNTPVYCVFSPIATPNNGNQEAVGALNYNGIYQQHSATTASLGCYMYRIAVLQSVDVIVHATGYWK